MEDTVSTCLLSNHVHDILNAAIRNNRKDRRINDAQALHTVHPQLVVDDALSDARR
jgi:hypothetical protein